MARVIKEIMIIHGSTQQKERYKCRDFLRAASYENVGSGRGLGESCDFLCSWWFPAVQAQQISTISGTDREWPFLQWLWYSEKKKEKTCCKVRSRLSLGASCTLSSRYCLIWGSVQKRKVLYSTRPISAQLNESESGIITCERNKEGRIIHSC
jgi:hypothetical protein